MIFDDELIGGIESNPIENWESLKLPKLIKDMELWADIIPKKEPAYRELWKVWRQQYAGLAIWMEYYLLHNRDLEEKIYSDHYLSGLKPHADLIASSHAFITQHFYPRLGYIWKELASTPDHLWILFEYCFFYSYIQKRITPKPSIIGKTETLEKMRIAINNCQEWFDDLNYKDSRNNLLSLCQPEKPKNFKLIQIKTDERVEAILKNCFSNQFNELAKRDKNFRAHYKVYIHQWDIYRISVKNSQAFQVMNIQCIDQEIILSASKKGRPASNKPKRTRGRPPKGQ